MKVALATCVNLPEPDLDEPLLREALVARGAEVRMLPWDDRSAVPNTGELVVLRSTWNYFNDIDGFLAWVERTAATTRLLNPAAVVMTNARKTYLRSLEQRGLPVVPTEYVMRRERVRIGELRKARGWDDSIVIKPVVSAGSFRTRRFEAEEDADAQEFLDDLTRERDAMIQRWMPSVETYGERSLVWIDGALTHAIRKSPRFSGGSEAVSGEQPIAPEERAFAERVLEVAGGDLLYARIDVVWDRDVLHLMELELIEPSLFLKQSRAALDRFADAIVRHARGGLT